MAVIENRSTSQGDVMLIRTDFPLIGLLTLRSFIANTVGENTYRSFKKEYRISTDGSNFSAWKVLALENIQAENVKSTDTVFLEYRLTRIGEDLSGEIEFNSIQLEGTFAEPVKQTHYDNSVFSSFFDSIDIKVLNWGVNVLEKLYQKGFVPDEIERNEDFVELYRPVCEFFSYHVQLARELKGFYQNNTLLANFLENRDLKLSGNESITVLQEYASNIYRELGKRGTVGIFSKSVDEVFGDNRFGEFLRLICYNEDSEFLFAFVDPVQSGWYLDKSAPMYRSNNYNEYNKLYENGFNDKPKWGISELDPLFEFRYGIMSISNVPAGEKRNIDPDGEPFLIPINKNQAYEFSFKVQQEDLTPLIVAGIRLYNENKIEVSPQNALALTDNNYFLNGAKLGKIDQEIKITCIVYPLGAANKVYKTSLAEGYNLNSNGASYMKPILGVSNTTGVISAPVHFYDFKITPLSPSGKSFLNLKNQLEIFCENNNDTLGDSEVSSITKNDLIPANTVLKINYL